MMNERIEELARQAGALPTQDCGVPQWYIDEDVFEKFAELIVEECVAQCWTVSESESKGSVVSECSKRIRKHFGVES
jgi:hypothetical protein